MSNSQRYSGERAECRQQHSIPNEFDALHLLGLIEYQRGHLPEALKLITGALPMDEKFIERHLEFLRQFFEFLRPSDGKKAKKS